MKTPHNANISSIKHGLTESLPIAAGYFPVAVAFGLSAVGTGLNAGQSIAMSIAVFAGAAQFLTLGMLTAGAAPLQIIVSGVLLNMRHLLFSATIAAKIGNWSVGCRLLSAFGLTDEVFAVASTKDDLQPGYLLGMEFGAYSAWVGGTAAGFFAGMLLSDNMRTALATGLYALFASLLAVHLRRSARNLIPAVSAAGINSLLSVSGMVAAGWSFTLAILAGAGLHTLLTRRGAEEPDVS